MGGFTTQSPKKATAGVGKKKKVSVDGYWIYFASHFYSLFQQAREIPMSDKAIFLNTAQIFYYRVSWRLNKLSCHVFFSGVWNAKICLLFFVLAHSIFLEVMRFGQMGFTYFLGFFCCS